MTSSAKTQAQTKQALRRNGRAMLTLRLLAMLVAQVATRIKARQAILAVQVALQTRARLAILVAHPENPLIFRHLNNAKPGSTPSSNLAHGSPLSAAQQSPRRAAHETDQLIQPCPSQS